MSTPINSVIETSPNELFNLTFRMGFDEPDEGFFSISFFWDNNESDTNSVYWNFTFVSFTAKFNDGSEFSNTLNLSIKKAVPNGFPNNYYRYTVSISEVYGEGRNGEFFLNVTLLAAGVVNGVCYPHAEGIQNITIVNVRCYESLLSESGLGNCSVMISPPSGFHNISVESMDCLKSVVGQGMCLIVNVTLYNGGDFAEIFDVKLYANATNIDIRNVNLAVGEFETLTFSWNTSDFVKGNYTLWVYAEPVPGETATSDNTLSDGVVYVGIPGDINGDGTVDIYDAILLSAAYGSMVGGSNWNPNADIDSTAEIDIFDAIILSTHFGETDP